MTLKTTLLNVLAALLLTTVTVSTASAEGDDLCLYSGPAREIVCAVERFAYNVVNCFEDPFQCLLGWFAQLPDELELDR